MRIRRRSLRRGLIAVGCVVSTVQFSAVAIGGLLLVAGVGLHVWSKGCLEQNLRLTTAGPYRWTRNPFYLANFLIDTGLCFVIGQWWLAAIYFPVWWVSYRETIAREEARLVELFPDAFPAYRSAVPALIPTGRGLPREAGAGRFSLDNPALARGAEYARVVGVGLSVGMLWASEWIREVRLGLFESRHSTTLALVVFLVVGWVVKLALAETFRRPETTLLPFGERPSLRFAVMGILLGLAIVEARPWAFGLPASWAVLWWLDRVGASRPGLETPGERVRWRYFPAIAAGSLGAFVCLALVVRVIDG